MGVNLLNRRRDGLLALEINLTDEFLWLTVLLDELVLPRCQDLPGRQRTHEVLIQISPQGIDLSC